VPGDTFRAAAAEQLAEWAKRANVTVGAFQDRAKPQKVIAQVRACIVLALGKRMHPCCRGAGAKPSSEATYFFWLVVFSGM